MRRSLAVVALCVASSVHAAEVTRLPNGNVSISARGTPLGTMLRQFEALMPLDTSLIDPKIERSQVNLALQDVPLPAALAAAFESAGVSYVVWGSDPANLRIVAFAQGGAPVDKSHGGSAKAAAAAAAAPPPPQEGHVLPNGIVLPPGISPDDPDVAMLGGPAPPRETPPEADPDLAEALGGDPDVPVDVEGAEILGQPLPPPEAEKKP